MYSPECYQQTFVTSNDTGTEEFQFQRIYITDRSKTLKLTVSNLAIDTVLATEQGISIFLENSSEISSKAFYVNQNGSSFARFNLGTIGHQVITYDSPVIYVNDLPLNKFTLIARDMSGVVVECLFSVTFKIEVI